MPPCVVSHLFVPSRLARSVKIYTYQILGSNYRGKMADFLGFCCIAVATFPGTSALVSYRNLQYLVVTNDNRCHIPETYRRAKSGDGRISKGDGQSRESDLPRLAKDFENRN